MSETSPDTPKDPGESLKAILAALPDPIEGDLAASGRVQLARIKDGEATILLDAEDLDDDQRAQLERRIRAALLSVPAVLSNRIAWTATKKARTIIAVGSGKGGVGKSTLSANLAIALARSGLKVGLVDADIYGPSQTQIMGRGDRPLLKNEKIVPVDAHGIRMLSIGQLIEQGTAVAWRGPMTASALGNLMEADWGDTELLVVDLPPGTGDIQMTLIQKWKPAGAVIVSTPQDLALIDATRAIDLFRKMDVAVLGLIENMSGYQCPHCGETSDPFGAGGAEAAARVLGVPFLGRVPLTMAIRAHSDAGEPLATGDTYEGKIFRALAEKVADALPGPKRSPSF